MANRSLLMEVELQGFKETAERLRSFPNRLRKNYMRGGMRQLVAYLRKGARRRLTQTTKTRSGELRRSIGISTRAFDDGTVIGKVWPGLITSGKLKGRTGWYGHIIEQGAKPHAIEPKLRKAVAFGGGVYARVAQHPGIKGRHFMRDTKAQDMGHGRQLFTQYVEVRAKADIEGKSVPK